MEKELLVLTAVALTLFSGCVGQSGEGGTPAGTEATAEETAVSKCKELCQSALAEGRDLSNGPCLSDDNPEWDVSGWVCDVAHKPRQPVDNQRENQCDEWWEGYNKGNPPKFVEVSPECGFIKTG